MPSRFDPGKRLSMHAASRKPHRLLASLALAVTSTLLALGLLEAGLRVRTRFVSPDTLEGAPLGVPPPDGHARLGHIVRLCADPRIVYELVPDLDVTFMGAPLRTNASGFRGPAVPAARTRPAVRIVGLGDSVMFGWGVSEQDTYLARLAQRLRAEHPGVAWEVVNTAVPGYNTVMEVETLETKGLRFDPDLVIVNFVGNDLGLPNFIEERPDPLDLRRSFLLDFVRARLRGQDEPGPHLVGVSRAERRFGSETDLSRVPPRYRGLVGLEAWRGAMQRLRALADAHGFAVVVLAHPEAFGYVREEAGALGFPLVETETAVRAWAAAHGLDAIKQPPLTVSEADPHPSPIGHQIIADALAQSLRSSGLAERLASRRSQARLRASPR
jgi:lysophospholipase L1-like esterase